MARNGSGKTSLLNCLTGADIPDSGNIVFRNEINVGYLKQEDNFDEDLSIMDTVFSTQNEVLSLIKEYSLCLEANDDMDKISELFERISELDAWSTENKIREILSKLRLSEFNKKVKMLSGGQRRRLALAKVLIEEPDLLILDEPTNGLDPVGIRQIRELLRELNNNGITIFISSHNLLEIQEICNRVGIIDRGEMILEDSIDKIRHLESNGVITVGVYNLTPEIINLIESLEFVVKTELKSENILDIFVNYEEDAKPEINKLIVENGGRVFKLIENSLSLEDAFFNVTKIRC